MTSLPRINESQPSPIPGIQLSSASTGSLGIGDQHHNSLPAMSSRGVSKSSMYVMENPLTTTPVSGSVALRNAVSLGNVNTGLQGMAQESNNSSKDGNSVNVGINVNANATPTLIPNNNEPPKPQQQSQPPQQHQQPEKKEGQLSTPSQPKILATAKIDEDLKPKQPNNKDDDEDDDDDKHRCPCRDICHRLGFKPIHFNTEWLQYWTYIIRVVNIFHIIAAPLTMAFPSFQTTLWIIIYVFMDIFMLTDVAIKSMVTTKNEYGILVDDFVILRKNYLFHRHGWINLTTSLPWDFLVLASQGFSSRITPINLWSIFRFLKAVFRFPYTDILFETHIPRVPMPISRLIKTMVVLMILGHVDSCVFWFVSILLDPGKRWVDFKNLLTKPDGTPVSLSTQYVTSYVSALRSLIKSPRDVYTNEESIFLIFEFAVGILVYGTVFGNIHSIVELMDKSAASTHAEERHKFEMKWLRSYMREKGFIPEIQKMIYSHKELQWRKNQGMDEAHLFDDMPKTVQQEIKNFLYLGLVKKVPLFQDLDTNFINSITFHIRPLVVLDGWYVFRKGDEAQEMYFIKSGAVEICNAEGTQVFATLRDGGFFGEIALLEDTKRTASVRALGNVELCVLTKEDFLGLLKQYPLVADRLREAVKARRENEARVKALATSASLHPNGAPGHVAIVVSPSTGTTNSANNNNTPPNASKNNNLNNAKSRGSSGSNSHSNGVEHNKFVKSFSRILQRGSSEFGKKILTGSDLCIKK